MVRRSVNASPDWRSEPNTEGIFRGRFTPGGQRQNGQQLMSDGCICMISRGLLPSAFSDILARILAPLHPGIGLDPGRQDTWWPDAGGGETRPRIQTLPAFTGSAQGAMILTPQPWRELQRHRVHAPEHRLQPGRHQRRAGQPPVRAHSCLLALLDRALTRGCWSDSVLFHFINGCGNPLPPAAPRLPCPRKFRSSSAAPATPGSVEESFFWKP